MSFLTVENLSVTFNQIPLFKELNFIIEKGDIVSILGPNGSGKTTLVKAILGLIPHQGTVKLDGKEIEKNYSKVGYVPQQFDFDKTFPITVAEFLDILPHQFDVSYRKKICADIKIDHLLEKELGVLSGGELQRVLIGQALLKNVEVLFLDEPTSGVDIEGTKNFYELLQHINKEHKITIILISHEISMVYKFSNKVLFLNQNTFCFGKPHDVLTQEFLKKMYGNGLELGEHVPHDKN